MSKVNLKKEFKTYKKLPYKEKVNFAKAEISNFLNCGISELNKFTDSRIIKTCDIMYDLLFKGYNGTYKFYNLVLKRLINGDNTLQEINNKFGNNKVFYYNNILKIGNNYIVGNVYEYNNNLEFKEHTLKTIDNFVITKQNGIFYLVTDEKFSTINVNTILFKNGLGRKSIAVPIHKISDINTKYINGKDWFKYYFFKEKTNGELYFLKIKYKDKIFYKIGLTKNGLNKRFSSDNFEILDKKIFKSDMLTISMLEQYLHHINFENRFHNNLDFEGSKECYHNNIFDINIDKLVKPSINFTAERCNISTDIIEQKLREING